MRLAAVVAASLRVAAGRYSQEKIMSEQTDLPKIRSSEKAWHVPMPTCEARISKYFAPPHLARGGYHRNRNITAAWLAAKNADRNNIGKNRQRF